MDPIAHLYAQMARENFDAVRGFKPSPPRFRASEVADCPRKIFHRLSGARPAPDPVSSNIYGYCGNIDHDIARQMFEHYGIKVGGIEHQSDGGVEETQSLSQIFTVTRPDGQVVDVEFSCRLDGLIDTDRGRCVLEIKGVGFNSFKWLNVEWSKGGEEAVVARVKEKHKYWYRQCMVSMKLSGLSTTYLVVKDRSSGNLGFFDEKRGHGGVHLAFDEAEWNDILLSMANIKLCVDAQVPPKTRRADGSQDCGWCPFYYLCHGADHRRQKKLEPIILYPGPQLEVHGAYDAKLFGEGAYDN